MVDYTELISKMTDEEKASLCSGADFWHTKGVARLGIPQMMLTDGPHGLRKQIGKNDHLGLNAAYPATCFPTASAAANSWDEAMIEQMGRRLGAETRAQRVGVILGPGVNIKRSPLCGRNFEYYSEDPLLAGKCAAALIRGVQSNGVAACVKHFAANSQETLRMTSDSVMDERTLREIYLPAFEIAVKEGRAKCLMTSYNMLNGQYTNENKHLLQDILTREWDYDGLIVTDWGGDNDRVRGLIAGNSLEMPGTGGETDRQILDAVQSGAVERELLDERVARLLRLVSDAESTFGSAPDCDLAEHHEFAARFAEECAVLLKNEDGTLPLKPGARIAVIGDFAKTPRYQGAGSSHIEPTKLECGLDALRAEGVNVIGFAPGFRRSGGESRRLREQACKLAGRADAVLMWLGLDEGSEAEGVDRQHMRIAENQIRLLREVSEVNPNVVVILSCGSPVEADWDCRAKALLHGYLGGQAGAKAIARLVSGKSCPSGKLAETMPLRLSDTPCFIRYPGAERTSEYREGIFVGYRYYDTANKAVKYPFGFGLSYTSFEYGGLELAPDGVSFTIKNTGSVPGAEIAQVYVAAPKGSVFCPEKELRGFARVALAPGETKRVFVRLPERAYQYWNIAENRWATAGGRYEILVGASSRDIRLRGAVEKPGDGAPDPYTDPVFAPYRRADVLLVPDASFAALLGREIPPHMWDKDAPLEFNSALVQGQFRPGLGRLLYRALRLVYGFFSLTGNAEGANNTEFAMNLPYRGLARFTGAVTEVQVKSLLRAANREKGGLRALVSAFVHKK